MTTKPFTVHVGTGAPLRRTDVDTDQIIPVRFLTHSSRTGHADSLFADWREDPSFVLNRPAYRNATVLVAGVDFGTGSSREYAVWALRDYGFTCVIAPRYGDIFRENALLNGLLTVTLPQEVIDRLWTLVERDATTPITVDLERLRVRCADVDQPFSLEEDVRRRLLAGSDPIAETLRHTDEIRAYEANRRPTLPLTTVLR
ncbi:3-isopropylmalate dehydratase small subunit [Actinomadura rubrisoli]|uniref:3-isopropylmalate dehydratase small subunit n=1 Tax=Actinomadura rubrisoli TaxID=2530368 RepID=A0A4R5B951_9ACTN|nr:3-isopropylmalate dehydratase small subunit [Actinomadura rubrisoli]TDD82858.1 3-isopropylmalate dehydratase small subunit [Actinomadura rubrisoli]